MNTAKVRIKKSKIKNNGDGLCAYNGNDDDDESIIFSKGEVISIGYIGDVINYTQYLKRKNANHGHYMFQLKKNTKYIDCYTNRCLCAYINSSIGGTVGNITANCRFLKNGKVIAIRNIKNNEELYICYQL